MPLAFAKLQAAGNVYLAVDGRTEDRDWPALARAMTAAHTGVGSDGLVVAQRSDRAPIRMRVFNSDGSEAEMSGNGLRLFTHFALGRGLVAAADGAVVVETGGGLRTVWPHFEGGRMVGGRIAMGVPEPTHDGTRTELTLAAPDSDPASDATADGQNPASEGASAWSRLAVTTLSLGNPHAVLLVPTPVADFPLAEIGPRVQAHPAFPDGVNFEVARVLDRATIEARIFERGEGETFSSGTGSTACAVAARLAGHTDARVTLRLRGGALIVGFEGPGEIAYLEGPTEEVFRGEWP